MHFKLLQQDRSHLGVEPGNPLLNTSMSPKCYSGYIQGVQYVHCMMHKCIMVNLGGNEKHVKHVLKETGKFNEIKGEILQNKEMYRFCENRGSYKI